VILADKPSAFQAEGSNAEHYTSIALCSTPNITINYVAKCLSLDDAPPPAGTFALYDPEGWQLTPADEFEHQGTAFKAAAAIIKQAGAVAIFAPSDPTNQRWVQCAARHTAETGGGVMVHLQTQPWESTLDDFMHVLRRATRWVHDVQPGMTVSFGVSTNPKYSPTAWKMWQDWLNAQGYLGGAAPCWLDIIKPTSSTAVTMATRVP
jgi:hypothetical protein